MSRPLVEVDHLTVRRGGSDRLSDVSFTLEAGEVLAVVGPNGAGKSTLLKSIAAELPIRRGEIRVLGQPLERWATPRLARIRGVLPQESSLTFPFTALEVVLMGRAPHVGRSSRERDQEIARQALDEVELGALENRLYPTLSGGERQRVHLARVLTQLWTDEPGEPRLLLLDEPVSNLDLARQHRVLELARRLADHGAAVMAVLHDLNLSAQHADRVAILRQGTLVNVGTPREVLTPRLLHHVFDVEAVILPHPCADCPLIVPVPVGGRRGAGAPMPNKPYQAM